MTAWKQNDNTNFNFYNAHEVNNIWQYSTEDTIKRNLRDRLKESKIFVLLIGEKTKYLYKYVRWEIEQAIKLDLPIIVVNLNGLRYQDEDKCPAIIRDELAIHISFNSRILQKALEEWRQDHVNLRSENKKGPYYFKSDVYQHLGL